MYIFFFCIFWSVICRMSMILVYYKDIMYVWLIKIICVYFNIVFINFFLYVFKKSEVILSSFLLIIVLLIC